MTSLVGLMTNRICKAKADMEFDKLCTRLLSVGIQSVPKNVNKDFVKNQSMFGMQLKPE